MIFSLNFKNSFLVFAGVAAAVLVFAHGGGQSLEKIVGDYKLDIGFDAEDGVKAGQSALFDFNLFTASGEKEVDFTDVWVRIMQDARIIFAGSIIKPEFGAPRMTAFFPQSGVYELTVRFQNKGEQIIETPLLLNVPEGEKRSDTGGSSQAVVAGVIGLLAGVIISFIFKKNRQSLKQ